MFFQLAPSRYERASLIVTTNNKEFGRWGEVFGDDTVAVAMIDRFVHHADVIAFKRDSYRLKNHDFGRSLAAVDTGNNYCGRSSSNRRRHRVSVCKDKPTLISRSRRPPTTSSPRESWRCLLTDAATLSSAWQYLRLSSVRRSLESGGRLPTCVANAGRTGLFIPVVTTFARAGRLRRSALGSPRHQPARAEGLRPPHGLAPGWPE